MDGARLASLRPGDGWDRAVRGYEARSEPAADVDHLSRFEAEMERLKTEREKAIQHAEDLGYQVEVLRAKLHEARRNLASRPAYDRDIGYQAEQLLRNAQIQADQLRADAERELREARAQTQRILQEHAEQAGAARRRSCTTRRSPAASQLDQELAERRPDRRVARQRERGLGRAAARPQRVAGPAAAGRVPGRGRGGAGRRPRRGRPGSPSETRQRLASRRGGGPRRGRAAAAPGPRGRRAAADRRLHAGPGGHRPRRAAAHLHPARVRRGPPRRPPS